MSQLEDRVVFLIRKLLREIPIQREVPVNKLFPKFRSGRERYDIVLPSMDIIVECHGAQHREIVRFGGQDAFKAYETLVKQRSRDRRKEEIALENDWRYAVIWYDELTGNDEKDVLLVKDKLMEAVESED